MKQKSVRCITKIYYGSITNSRRFKFAYRYKRKFQIKNNKTIAKKCKIRYTEFVEKKRKQKEKTMKETIAKHFEELKSLP